MEHGAEGRALSSRPDHIHETLLPRIVASTHVLVGMKIGRLHIGPWQEDEIIHVFLHRGQVDWQYLMKRI